MAGPYLAPELRAPQASEVRAVSTDSNRQADTSASAWSTFVGTSRADARVDPRTGCAGDAALRAATLAMLAEASATSGTQRSWPAPSGRKLRTIVQQAGSAAVWPRFTFVHGTSLSDVETHALRFIASSASAESRCAVTTERLPGAHYVAAVLVADVRGSLDAVARVHRVRERVEMYFTPPAAGGLVSVTVRGPADSFTHPRIAPEGDDGVRWVVPLTSEGEYSVQIMLDTGNGPRPAARATLIAREPVAGAAPPTYVPTQPPVADPATTSAFDDSMQFAYISELRRRKGRPLLARNPALDRLAAAQLARAITSQVVAHDTGDGTLPVRAARAGLQAAAWGENIGRSSSLQEAFEGLLDSPSHAENLVSDAFDQFGSATAMDPAGNAWIVQTFAKQARPKTLAR